MSEESQQFAYIILEWSGPLYNPKLLVKGVAFDEAVAEAIVNAHPETGYSYWFYEKAPILIERARERGGRDE
jgi:hypothetical protein